MTFLNPALSIPRENIGKYINSLTWKAWVPKFTVLHNTGIPSLETWKINRQRYSEIELMSSQKHYERDIKHWHSGVHFFCPPSGNILVLCDPTADGVHCSCWNHLSFGIEMVGDYSREDFNSGAGAMVRDNAVALMTAINKKFKWMPDNFKEGVEGLHFHKMCTKDHHDCPGKGVVYADMVHRVKTAMQMDAIA